MRAVPICGPDGLYRTMERVDGYDCVRVLGAGVPATFAAGSIEVDLSGLSDEAEPVFEIEIGTTTLLALLEREQFERTGRR